MGYVTASQAAKHLGISDDTVRRRAKAGEWPSREDAIGRLLVDVPGMAEVVSGPPPEVRLTGGVISEAVHLHNLLMERTEQLRQAQGEIDYLREQNRELTGALRQALRPARQTRQQRRLVALSGTQDQRRLR